MMYPNTRIIQVSVRVSRERECVNDIDGLYVKGSGRCDVPEYSNNSKYVPITPTHPPTGLSEPCWKRGR